MLFFTIHIMLALTFIMCLVFALTLGRSINQCGNGSSLTEVDLTKQASYVMQLLKLSKIQMAESRHILPHLFHKNLQICKITTHT